MADAIATNDGARIYPIDRITKIVLLICAAISLCMGFGFLLAGMFVAVSRDRIAGVAGGLIFIPLGLLAAAIAVKYATILYPDRVQRRGIFASRSMKKADIESYRIVPGRNEPDYMKLTSKVAGERSLNVYRFQPDEAFDHWFQHIPNLTESGALSSN